MSHSGISETNDNTIVQSLFEGIKEKHLIGSRDCPIKIRSKHNIEHPRRETIDITMYRLVSYQGASTRRPVLFPVRSITAVVERKGKICK